MLIINAATVTKVDITLNVALTFGPTADDLTLELLGSTYTTSFWVR